MADRHPPAKSLLFAEFCKKYPVLRLNHRGDRFAFDCAHHHPVFLNRRLPRRLQRGRFCGDIRHSHCTFSVSTDVGGLPSRFLASGLRIQKFRSRRLNFVRELPGSRSCGIRPIPAWRRASVRQKSLPISRMFCFTPWGLEILTNWRRHLNSYS